MSRQERTQGAAARNVRRFGHLDLPRRGAGEGQRRLRLGRAHSQTRCGRVAGKGASASSTFPRSHGRRPWRPTITIRRFRSRRIRRYPTAHSVASHAPSTKRIRRRAPKEKSSTAVACTGMSTYDVTDLGNVKPLAPFEVSELDSRFARTPGARFGAHQFHERDGRACACGVVQRRLAHRRCGGIRPRRRPARRRMTCSSIKLA
jgi:hypothetical protein